MKFLPLILTVIVMALLWVSGGLSDQLQESRASLASQEQNQVSLQLKAEKCALKASQVANNVDPRLYMDSIAQRIYKSCLEVNENNYAHQ